MKDRNGWEIRPGAYVRVEPTPLEGQFACEPYRGRVARIDVDGTVRLLTASGTRDAREGWCVVVRPGLWAERMHEEREAASVPPRRTNA